MPKSVRRTSISTIGWTESIREFEGDLGSVHISGERALVDDDRSQSPASTRSMSRQVLARFTEVEEITEGESDEAADTVLPSMVNGIGALYEESQESQKTSRMSPESQGKQDVASDINVPKQRNVVVSGQWEQALQMMQEFEDEAQMKNARRSLRIRTWKSSSKASRTSSGPEGYVDRELRDACKLGVMSASALESRRRRGSDYTLRGLFG
jgi:hypothetical protein